MNANEENPAPVPPAAVQGLQHCKMAGVQDLSDIRGVLRWLRDEGWYTAADWVEKNPHTYRDAFESTVDGG